MFSNQKKKSIARRFHKDKLKQLSSSRNMNTKVIKKIAVLLEESHLLTSNTFLNQLQQEFKIPLDNIQLLVFRPFQKEDVYSEFDITENDFGWYGSLK